MELSELVKKLDDWCYMNVDCNLHAWLGADERDKELSDKFYKYLHELLSGFEITTSKEAIERLERILKKLKEISFNT